MKSISTLRKRARAVGYSIKQGFQHYTVSGAIFTNWNGERFPGYMVLDLATNCYVWGSYDEYYTYLWQLEDVENFLREVYERNGLTWQFHEQSRVKS